MKKSIVIDSPRPGVPSRHYPGWLEASGWAVASQAIHDVRARVDGGPWSRATYCQPRPDVLAAHADLARADRSGFHVFVRAGREARRLEVQVTAGDRPVRFGTTVELTSEAREIRVADGDADADTDTAECPWCGAATSRYREPIARGPFHLTSCGRCDFGFVEPRPAAESLSEIYDTEYWARSPQDADEMHPSGDTELVAGLVERFGNGGRRILEVGCGQGTLLLGLQQCGFDVSGQDLARNSAQALARHHAVRIRRQPIGAIATGERWDGIVARHVVEHSATPRRDLRWMRDHLAPGGVVVLVTPNRRSLAAEVLGATWEWFVPPVHVGYFSPRSFTFADDAVGLAPLLLTTREGDGAPLIPSLQAFCAYERDRLPPWRRQQCQDLLAAAGGGIAAMLAGGGGAAGLGQEIVAVLTAT